MAIPVDAGTGGDRFCSALVRSGLLRTRPPSGALSGGFGQAIGPRSVRLAEGGVAAVGGRLNLADRGQLMVRASGQLLPDVMRALRPQLGAPLAPARGGADNLAVPYEPGGCRPLLAWQLRAVAGLVDAVVGDLAAAAGVPADRLGGGIWVQQAEFCRDYAWEGAEAYVRDLRLRPIPGARHGRARLFRDRRGNGLCLSWDDGTNSLPGAQGLRQAARLGAGRDLPAEPQGRHRAARRGAAGAARRTLRGEDVAGALGRLALGRRPAARRDGRPGRRRAGRRAAGRPGVRPGLRPALAPGRPGAPRARGRGPPPGPRRGARWPAWRSSACSRRACSTCGAGLPRRRAGCPEGHGGRRGAAHDAAGSRACSPSRRSSRPPGRPWRTCRGSPSGRPGLTRRRATPARERAASGNGGAPAGAARRPGTDRAPRASAAAGPRARTARCAGRGSLPPRTDVMGVSPPDAPQSPAGPAGLAASGAHPP